MVQAHRKRARRSNKASLRGSTITDKLSHSSSSSSSSTIPIRRERTLAMEVRHLLKDKKFWLASALIAWAAALQGHMMWIQRQDSFKQKFGDLADESPRKD